ncbi:hypothetical protein pb186bvf_009335 [Paramecium bursaria]
MKFDKHQKTKQVRIVDQMDQFEFENSQKKLENKDIYIEEMRLKVKLKDMNYDQIAQQYLKSQKLNDELKSKLQMAEDESSSLKDKFHQKQIQIASLEKKYDDYKKLFMSVQQELAQEKIKSTKVLYLAQNIKQLTQEIQQLKEELKKKSNFQLNLQKCEDQSVDTISTCNRRSTMDKSSTDLVSFLQRELKNQQIQINEKNKTIELMGEQIKAQMNTIQSLSKIHQSDVNKLKTQKFEGQIKSPDSGRQSVLYSCISDNKLQTIKEIDNSPIVNRTYQSQNSLKSTATLRDRKSIKDVYHKLNQSTLYQAALKSNCLDYSTLHIEPQFLNDTNSNDER